MLVPWIFDTFKTQPVSRQTCLEFNALDRSEIVEPEAKLQGKESRLPTSTHATQWRV